MKYKIRGGRFLYRYKFLGDFSDRPRDAAERPKRLGGGRERVDAALNHGLSCRCQVVDPGAGDQFCRAAHPEGSPPQRRRGRQPRRGRLRRGEQRLRRRQGGWPAAGRRQSVDWASSNSRVRTAGARRRPGSTNRACPNSGRGRHSGRELSIGQAFRWCGPNIVAEPTASTTTAAAAIAIDDRPRDRRRAGRRRGSGSGWPRSRSTPGRRRPGRARPPACSRTAPSGPRPSSPRRRRRHRTPGRRRAG